jgi:hypothetical protein
MLERRLVQLKHHTNSRKVKLLHSPCGKLKDIEEQQDEYQHTFHLFPFSFFFVESKKEKER